MNANYRDEFQTPNENPTKIVLTGRKAWFPHNHYDHLNLCDRCYRSKNLTYQSQLSYGKLELCDHHDRYNCCVHGFHMTVAIAKLISFSDHNDHRDLSDYMEIRLLAFSCTFISLTVISLRRNPKFPRKKGQ